MPRAETLRVRFRAAATAVQFWPTVFHAGFCWMAEQGGIETVESVLDGSYTNYGPRPRHGAAQPAADFKQEVQRWKGMTGTEFRDEISKVVGGT